MTLVPEISIYSVKKAKSYRYAFNGKERDSEGMGGGSSTYDYGFRIYNPALGKFLSVDPLIQKFAFYSPFQYAGNKPIVAIDLDGLEDCWTHSWTNADGTGGSIIKYSDEEDFEEFKNQMAADLGIPLSEIPETGGFNTHQTWNSDNSRAEVYTSYIPTINIDGRSLFEKMGQGITDLMTDANDWLNSFSSADNGYELEGEAGLVEYSDKINDLGTDLTYTPLFEIGALLKSGSLVIDTALDFKNLPTDQALLKSLPNVATYLTGKKVDQFLEQNKTGDLLFDEMGRAFIKGTHEKAADVTTDAIHDEIESDGN